MGKTNVAGTYGTFESRMFPRAELMSLTLLSSSTSLLHNPTHNADVTEKLVVFCVPSWLGLGQMHVCSG